MMGNNRLTLILQLSGGDTLVLTLLLFKTKKKNKSESKVYLGGFGEEFGECKGDDSGDGRRGGTGGGATSFWEAFGEPNGDLSRYWNIEMERKNQNRTNKRSRSKVLFMQVSQSKS